jgi:hypothetical protein
MVPSRTVTHRSPAYRHDLRDFEQCNQSPTIGVHRPGMRRSPNPVRNAEIIVVVTGGLLHSAEFARSSSEAPRTTRMRSKPIPGQPSETERTLKRVVISHSLEFVLAARNQPKEI